MKNCIIGQDNVVQSLLKEINALIELSAQARSADLKSKIEVIGECAMKVRERWDHVIRSVNKVLHSVSESEKKVGRTQFQGRINVFLGPSGCCCRKKCYHSDPLLVGHAGSSAPERTGTTNRSDGQTTEDKRGQSKPPDRRAASNKSQAFPRASFRKGISKVGRMASGLWSS